MLIPSTLVAQTPASYLRRQAEIAALATGPDGLPATIAYSNEEHETWAKAQARLEPVWERHAAWQLRAAKVALDLPRDEIPQLAVVSDRLTELTGFRYASVAGTVPGPEFFGALGRRIFSSTQFIRWSGNPDYTPEPDVLHEVGGHAVALANPQLADLHRLAGKASVAAPSMLSAIAAVFWYSIEFGVVASPSGWKAYGTGLLSSPGELAWFGTNAEIRPLNIAEMIVTPYDINRYQPVLFGAESLDQAYSVVSAFYSDIINYSDTACAIPTA